MTLPDMLKKINIKLCGMFRYYGISGMFEEIRKIWNYTRYTLYKWLNRRGDKRSFKWKDFDRVWKHYMERPKIYVNLWNYQRT